MSGWYSISTLDSVSCDFLNWKNSFLTKSFSLLDFSSAQKSIVNLLLLRFLTPFYEFFLRVSLFWHSGEPKNRETVEWIGHALWRENIFPVRNIKFTQYHVNDRSTNSLISHKMAFLLSIPFWKTKERNLLQITRGARTAGPRVLMRWGEQPP